LKLLLDTHVVLWQLSGAARIGPGAVHAIGEADEVAMSVVSFAEIGVKAAIGKLEVPEDLEAQIRALDVRVLPLEAHQALAVGGLPIHHRDPFDRLLIAQALAERMTLVSADRRFADYGASLIDAGV